MAPNVFSLAGRIADRSAPLDWTNAELAELYRVEHALVQARISIETDRGVTDEGDPWFVFCRADGEVVVHITRFGGFYRLYSPALPKPLVGPTFSALTKTFLGGLRTPIKPEEGVSIHPAALLSVLIAAIFFSIDFHSGAAHAAEAVAHGTPEHQSEAQAGPLPALPAKDTVFHTLVANLKAFIDSVTPWDSEQTAVLATVENAVVFALSPVAGLGESVITASPLAANTQGWQGLDPTGDLSLQVPSSGAQNGLKAFLDEGSILANRPDSAQASGTHSQNAALIWQGNQFSAPVDLTPGAASESGGLPAAVFQSSGDGARQDSFASLRVGDPMPPLTRGNADISNAGNSAAADQNAVPGPDNAIQVNLAQAPQSVDLSASTGNQTIETFGDGLLRVSGISGTPQIDVSANSTQTVTLLFEANAHPAATVQLNGNDVVTLANLSTDLAAPSNTRVSSGTIPSGSAVTSGGATADNTPDGSSDPTSGTTSASPGSSSINLILDSEGNTANTVTIANNAVSSTTKLNITVEGVQALTLNESAQIFSNSSINSTGLTAALTVSLDLGNVFQSVDLSQVSAANFIVGDSGNIALLNAASGSHIQLGSNLNIVDLSIAGATAAAPGALAVDLQASAMNAIPISVNTLDAFSTASLAINSTGAGAGGNNTIETLTDSSLTTLTITGNSGLTISALNGPTASNSQNITIDAHALTGSLVLDVSGIADTALSGRSITIMAGAGASFLTNDTVSESTAFVAGSGTMIVDIGGGAIKDSIIGLAANDAVNVGTATRADVVINESAVGSEQATIDHQTSVTAAAQLAAGLANSSSAHQAVLFTYEGSLYVFVDASGSHTFDASTDAIIKLVGLAATANLAGVFHSA